MRLLIAIALTAALLAGCQVPANVYTVVAVPEAGIKVDGDMNEPAWSKAAVLTDFKEPWAGGGEATTFRAVADHKNLYFAFDCRESTPKIEKDWQGKRTVVNEDRVEIYFALDGKLEKYFCLEIDPTGRVLDYSATFPRKFDESWSMPGLKAVGKGTAGGYTVECSIPLASLEALGLPSPRTGGEWRVGLFRADLGRAGPNSDHWITWVVPNSATPNFHTPSAFGRFRFR